MEESIEQRSDGGGIAEQLAPIVDGSIGRQQRGRALVTAHDDFQEIFRRRVRQLPHTEIIDDEQWHGRKFAEIQLPRAIEGGVGEFFEERVRLTVDNAIALLDHGAADGLGQMTLPRPWWAEQERVFPLRDEAAGRQLV